MPTSRRNFLKTAGVALGAAAAGSASAAAEIPKVLANSESEILAVRVVRPDTLWYTRPAANWLEALPIGNGRIAAMVFGGVAEERLQLNEGTLWAGGPHDYTSPEGFAALPEIRKAVFEGRWVEAQKLVDTKFLSRPATQMPYQTAGSLLLKFAGITGVEQEYNRELDLSTAVTTSQFSADGVVYRREAFASVPDQVIVVRITSSKPGALSFQARFDCPLKGESHAENTTLTVTGISGDSAGITGAVKFQASVRIAVTGGRVGPSDDGKSLVVANADSAVLRIAIATSYVNYNDVSADPAAAVTAVLAQTETHSFDRMLKTHVQDYEKLFKRVVLDLGVSESENLPTDERVRQFAMGRDPQLARLHFQFGRYLLISSSRAGGQPATLQGLWNDSTTPPWGSKYTVNINTEMNYWPAGPANLLECYAPLVQALKELSVAGQRTAKGLYGANGWVCHHNMDAWRGTSPIDAAFYGMWPTGGAWLCKSLWDQYEYSQDARQLADVYPILKGAAQFFLDSLVPDPAHGWLVTCPSNSPEHGHHAGASICAGPTMDNQILHDLFDSCIKAADILKQDPDLRQRWAQTKAKLAPMQVGKEGQLQEWLEDWDMNAEDIHHRHVSHLYGLYPSDQITLEESPDLFAAAKKSLEIRGDMATGWSLAWKINLWARLRDGDRAWKLLGDLLTPERTAPNLFDLHPPFQIDGNFGAAAGIAEMLLQCRRGALHLLPALPAAIPNGRINGLLARGGFSLDISWRNGALAQVKITSRAGKPCVLRSGTHEVTLQTKAGGTYTLDGSLRKI